MIVSETRFFGPTALCPHPEYWTASSDDESAEYQITPLIGALIVALQPDFVLESGTAFGQTSKVMAEALAANGHGRMVSLDIEDTRIEDARELCAGLPVEFVHGDTAAYEPPEVIDFAWIDSGHNRAGEIEHLKPWLRPGSIIAVHDTGPDFPTVRPHIELLEGFRSVYFPTPRGMGILEKL